MTPESFNLGRFYTIDREPIDFGFLKDRGIDPYHVKSIDFHCHTGISPCASNKMTLDAIANEAFFKDLDQVCITDHNSAESLSEGVQIDGVDLIPGVEVKTPYDEFNVIGLKSSEEAQLILDGPKFQEKIDMHPALDMVDDIRESHTDQRYDTPLLIFNHPFSSLPIPNSLPGLVGYKPRGGFDFVKYIIDCIPQEMFDQALNMNSELFRKYVKFHSDYQTAPHAFCSESSGCNENDPDFISRIFTFHDKDARRMLAQELEIDTYVEKKLLSKQKTKDRRHSMYDIIIYGLVGRFDAIEINCINTSTEDAKKAKKLADKYSIPIVAGGDSHSLGMIGQKGLNIYPADMHYADALREGKMIPAFTKAFHNPFLNYMTSTTNRAANAYRKIQNS